jgi:hypothetical protein
MLKIQNSRDRIPANPSGLRTVTLVAPGEQSYTKHMLKLNMDVELGLVRDLAHKAVQYLPTLHFDIAIRP